MDEETKKLIADAVAEAIADTNKQRDDSEVGLKKKLEEVLSERKADQAKAKEAAELAEKATAEAARKSGDVEALEASWRKKLESAEAKAGETITALRGSVESLTVGQSATSIAAELAVPGSAGVLERFVRDRLAVEMGEDGAVVRVLDQAGKPSAHSMDDLKKELAANPALAPIIAASKATGGGAASANGGAGGGKSITSEQLEQMAPREKATFFKDNPSVSVIS